jgi:hypothetical protein
MDLAILHQRNGPVVTTLFLFCTDHFHLINGRSVEVSGNDVYLHWFGFVE